MNTLDKFFNDFYQQKTMGLLPKMLMSLVFATSETSEKRVIIQSINIVMNNKSTQNTQENVVKYSFIEFSVFHVILQ